MLPSPTIKVEIPRPPWQRLLLRAGTVLAVAAWGAVAFRAGQYFPLPGAPAGEAMAVPLETASEAPAAQAAAVPQASAAKPAPPATTAATAPAAPGTEETVAATADGDGLELKSFSLDSDAGNPRLLRYHLILANSGRKFTGSLQFVVIGERDGKPDTWRYPASGQRPDPKLKVEVSRYLKTAGVIPLPDGFTPSAATVDLLEPGGVRLSQQTKMGRTS